MIAPQLHGLLGGVDGAGGARNIKNALITLNFHGLFAGVGCAGGHRMIEHTSMFASSENELGDTSNGAKIHPTQVVLSCSNHAATLKTKAASRCDSGAGRWSQLGLDSEL